MSVVDRVITTVPSRLALLDERSVDRIFAVLAGWLMSGVLLDAWAHISGLPDSFWTPWHGVLYSGLVACGAFLVIAKTAERVAARPLLRAGYDPSLIGFAVAGLGGVADAIWHTLFGIEFDVEAAVSPSHLAVAAGIFLLVTGPARAMWERRSMTLPGALSLVYGLSIVAIILDYANPFTRLMGAGLAPPAMTSAGPGLRSLAQLDQTVALLTFMLYGALVSGAALLTARRIAAAPYWFALIVGGNAVAMIFANSPLLGPDVWLAVSIAVAGALLGAIAAALLRPAPDRPWAARGFAFALPALMAAAYSIGVTAGLGTWWSVTFWCGLIATTGLAGLLVSALVSPSRS